MEADDICWFPFLITKFVSSPCDRLSFMSLSVIRLARQGTKCEGTEFIFLNTRPYKNLIYVNMDMGFYNIILEGKLCCVCISK
jgi:hypothetical protein